VIESIHRLLDAGHGPQQLARQFVRYLRNCVMAEVTALAPDAEATGLAADLLQISPEERRRVARSAALFTEEDLSRFLSIMLRTFDDLGYRQEQRFHLELGLLKLVHAQRLVPIEDLLSQLGVPQGSQPAGSSARPAPPHTVTAAASPAPVSSPNAVPLRSTPFEADRTRKSQSVRSAVATAPHSVAPQPAPAPLTTEGALALTPHLTPTPPAEGPRLVTVEPLPQEPEAAPEVALQSAPLPSVPGAPNLEALQTAMVSTLAATKGQQSASEQIEDAAFTLTDSTLTIQTELSATILPVLLNGETERILKNVLREQGHAAIKLKLLPGRSTTAANVTKTPRSAPSGSARELAANHPVVQQAQRLFGAEIRNVVDLRKS